MRGEDHAGERQQRLDADERGRAPAGQGRADDEMQDGGDRKGEAGGEDDEELIRALDGATLPRFGALAAPSVRLLQ